MSPPLPPPARYFPLESGRYEVAPGLSRFGRDFSNGDADRHVFQIDNTFEHYRQVKLASRRERLSKYLQTHAFDAATCSAVTRFIADRLTLEHPRLFSRSADLLDCRLTGSSIDLGSDSAFDALACHVQEDLAVIRSEPGRHWLAAVHLCFPNHWAAEDKIGKDFASIHEPVAGMAEMNRRSAEFARLMVEATGGFVRFAWGVTFDDELNHHPNPPAGQRRSFRFDPAVPRAFLRVERQTIRGFPEAGASLFTIRTYLTDCQEIRRDSDKRDKLISALASMTPQSLVYKGLLDSRDALLDWL